MGCLKYLLPLLFLNVTCHAFDAVSVLNSTNNPVNVTCVSGCSSSSAVSSTFTLVNVATVTFNGSAQPVSLTGVPLVPTGVNASTTAVINQTGNNLNVNIAAGSAIPDRASQKSGRTYVQGFGDNLSSNTTIYTVTNGKKLYVTTMNISGYNTSTSNVARLRIQDAGTTVIPISGPSAGVGAAAASTSMSLAGDVFPEPKQFSTNINVNVVSGTLTFSLDFTGYEE